MSSDAKKSKPKVVVEDVSGDTPIAPGNITKEPEEGKAVSTTKNLKKVHAGKMLAKKNREARDALKRQQEAEEGSSLGNMGNEKKEKESSWLPEMSFGTVVSVVGIGIALADIVLRVKETDFQLPWSSKTPKTLHAPFPPPPVEMVVFPVTDKDNTLTPNKLGNTTLNTASRFGME